jgi:hypothetical protein
VHISGDQQLHIPRASLADADPYTCEAINAAGTDEVLCMAFQVIYICLFF